MSWRKKFVVKVKRIIRHWKLCRKIYVWHTFVFEIVSDFSKLFTTEVSEESLSISKRMILSLRHSESFRKSDRTIHWDFLCYVLLRGCDQNCRVDLGRQKNISGAWDGERPIRLQSGQKWSILCMRAFQGHSGGADIDTTLQSDVRITYG